MIRILLALAGTLGVCPALAQDHPAPRVEVAFVLDATGSMGSYIGEARDRIQAIAADLATGEPAPEVRFALVRFRDEGDTYVTQAVPFTHDLTAMRSALAATDADGGGDTPEAVLEGLRVGVEDLKWSQDRGVLRLLYLVGDAEPQHYATSPTLEYIAVRALERGIVIHSIACGAMGTEGQHFFEEVARLSEGRPFRLADGEATVHSKAGAAGAGSLAAAVSGSARAYSGAIGVGFAGRHVEAAPLKIPHETGLLGAHLRHVRDAASFADLWTAHRLEAPDTLPAIDFSREHVLVVGGADAGLRLDDLTADGRVQVAHLAPASPGARFYRIPASELPVIMGEF